jgi:hypothetical protein
LFDDGAGLNGHVAEQQKDVSGNRVPVGPNPYAKHPLLPKKHELPANPDSITFFRNVRVLDSTGRLPYLSNVLILGERIAAIGGSVQPPPGATIIEGRGRTLMSGLGDAHTHFTWNNTGSAPHHLLVPSPFMAEINSKETSTDWASCPWKNTPSSPLELPEV